MTTNWTIESVREAIATKKTSAREIAEDYYKRIAAKNPEIECVSDVVRRPRLRAGKTCGRDGR